MPKRASNKKQLILTRAKTVFSEQGFKNVTMTDLVNACQISRGGLYRYYGSTKEVFLEVLKNERYETSSVIVEGVEEGFTAPEILLSFLEEQKQDLLNEEDKLTLATYEFFSENRDQKMRKLLEQQFEEAVSHLVTLIRYGQERDEFNSLSPRVVAENIVLFFEGLRISALVMELPEGLIERQLSFLSNLLIK